jgi:hypothetical protein
MYHNFYKLKRIPLIILGKKKETINLVEVQHLRTRFDIYLIQSHNFVSIQTRSIYSHLKLLLIYYIRSRICVVYS